MSELSQYSIHRGAYLRSRCDDLRLGRAYVQGRAGTSIHRISGLPDETDITRHGADPARRAGGKRASRQIGLVTLRGKQGSEGMRIVTEALKALRARPD
jgi:hypothetical protein